MINPSSDKPLVATFEVEAPRSSLQSASNGNGVSESNSNFRAGGGKKTSAYEQSNLTRGQLQIWMGKNLLQEYPQEELTRETQVLAARFDCTAQD